MQWPTWTELRAVGNSLAVRAAIIVPVIGYFIILNETIGEYSKMWGLEPHLQPPTWWDRLWNVKIYFVYFGLMSLGIGSAIFQSKCPHFVKRFGDWADYVAGVGPHADPSQIQQLAMQVGRDFLKDQQSGAMQASRDDLLRRYLTMDYKIMSEDGRPWRIACTVLFSFGFVLLAIPSIMTAVRVAIALLGS